MAGVFVQLLVSGIAMGFIYALVGIEYTLVWNSTGLLNFSHEKLITVGAYIFAGTFVGKLGMSFGLSVPMTLLLSGVLGALVASAIFNPLRSMSSTIFAIMGTIILGRILSESIRLIWGPAPFAVANWLSGYFRFENFTIAKANVYICIVSIVVVVALEAFLKYTKTGKAMRCVAQNKKAAELMGINVGLNICVTTGISAMICAIIGMMITPLFNINTNMAVMIGLKGFSSGVIGGFGFLPGAIVGGLVIGVLENIAVMFLPAVYKDVVSFVLLIIFLLVKPAGILGKKA